MSLLQLMKQIRGIIDGLEYMHQRDVPVFHGDLTGVSVVFLACGVSGVLSDDNTSRT